MLRSARVCCAGQGHWTGQRHQPGAAPACRTIPVRCRALKQQLGVADTRARAPDAAHIAGTHPKGPRHSARNCRLHCRPHLSGAPSAVCLCTPSKAPCPYRRAAGHRRRGVLRAAGLAWRGGDRAPPAQPQGALQVRDQHHHRPAVKHCSQAVQVGPPPAGWTGQTGTEGVKDHEADQCCCLSQQSGAPPPALGFVVLLGNVCAGSPPECMVSPRVWRLLPCQVWHPLCHRGHHQPCHVCSPVPAAEQPGCVPAGQAVALAGSFVIVHACGLLGVFCPSAHDQSGTPKPGGPCRRCPDTAACSRQAPACFEGNPTLCFLC